MDEFWICQHCRSFNRAGSGECHRCRNKLGSRPADVSPVSRTAAATTARPPAAPRPGVNIGPLAPYPSQSVALAPIAGPTSEPARAAGEPFHFSNPLALLRRRVAWSPATRPSVSASLLGCVTAALLAAVFVLGSILILAGMPVAASLLQNANPETAWAQLSTGAQGLLISLSIVFVTAGLLALECFSVFVSLTTLNGIGPGADGPMLTPYRAGHAGRASCGRRRALPWACRLPRPSSGRVIRSRACW